MKVHIENPREYVIKIRDSYRLYRHVLDCTYTDLLNYQVSKVYSILSKFLVDYKLPLHKVYKALSSKKNTPVDIEIDKGKYFYITKKEMINYMMYSPEQLSRLYSVKPSTAAKIKKEVSFLVTGYRKGEQFKTNNLVVSSTVTTTVIG